MKRVFKYELVIGDDQAVEMPGGATILTAQVQGRGDRVCVWALVDDERATETRRFRIVGTGHGIRDADDLAYIGTVQLDGGALVFHVFEVTA